MKIRKSNNSESVAALINPVNGYREMQRRKGIQPKNFEKENRLRLRQLQNQVKEKKTLEAVPPKEIFKMDKFKKISSRVGSKKSNQDELNDCSPRKPFLKKHSGEQRLMQPKIQNTPRRKSYCSGSSSPSNGSDYSSNQSFSAYSCHRRFHAEVKEKVPTMKELVERERQLRKLVPERRVDYIDCNAREVINKIAERVPIDSGPMWHKSFGQVPDYLMRRKEKWAEEAEEKIRNAPDPDCPPGMIRMEESERKRSLEILQESRKEAQNQLFNMPLRVHTPSQIRRKNELEARLKEIEDSIEIFDRPKVFVAAA